MTRLLRGKLGIINPYALNEISLVYNSMEIIATRLIALDRVDPLRQFYHG
jgi:hypothetical protein